MSSSMDEENASSSSDPYNDEEDSSEPPTTTQPGAKAITARSNSTMKRDVFQSRILMRRNNNHTNSDTQQHPEAINRPPSLYTSTLERFNGQQQLHVEPSPAGTMRSHRSYLVRPERVVHKQSILAPSDESKLNAWRLFSWAVTCCCWPWCLSKLGKTRLDVQQAWREKIALCVIIVIMCGALGFLTFGFTSVLCVRSGVSFNPTDVGNYSPDSFPHRFIIHGGLYDLTKFLPWHANLVASDQIDVATGVDISDYFPNLGPNCRATIVSAVNMTCTSQNFSSSLNHCHDFSAASSALSQLRLGDVTYSWTDITRTNSTLMVFRSHVLDMSRYLSQHNKFLGDWADGTVRSHLGRDGTKAFGNYGNTRIIGECLSELYTVGTLPNESMGCLISDVILYLSLMVILSLVIVRFVLAIFFRWFISNELGKLEKASERRASVVSSKHPETPKSMTSSSHKSPSSAKSPMDSPKLTTTAYPTLDPDTPASVESLQSNNNHNSPVPSPGHQNIGPLRRISQNITLSITSALRGDAASAVASPTASYVSSVVDYMQSIHTVMLVTCYSESEDGLRKTFDSLAATTFSARHKLLFIVADGIITGSGNKSSTPDLILGMLELDSHWPSDPEPQSYLAIASGSKRHNKAKVYPAWYNCAGQRVPTILIVKCGSADEQGKPKPGNRGKRDSQIILMNFFRRVMFDEPMCPLEFDMFRKIQYVSGVTPDYYEIVLMVDADTMVAPDSLSRMVAAMARDPRVMGLCGETRIANKTESWVSRIQVFEYYLSHHLNKAFESVFGGVTCLPGCFCMWRIKSPKLTAAGPAWVPILANPDIVSTYSENVVNTLHKKNLLLLGEDRFLTTLMLRQFPRRRLIFVPSACCKTVVPAEFKVLLSQRRRWINSTIHNLLELVMVNELCGIFCFSMQFVIFIELIGTVVLPAAISFTLFLIIISIVGPTVPLIPLLLLAAILGLPAFLVLFTTRRVIYIYWMGVYLLSLPIWNFVLPVYAFWHFDDFSWGETRKVEGEKKDTGHGGGDGTMDLQSVPLLRWAEWEVERRKAVQKSAERKRRKKQKAVALKIAAANAVAVSTPTPVTATSKIGSVGEVKGTPSRGESGYLTTPAAAGKGTLSRVVVVGPSGASLSATSSRPDVDSGDASDTEFVGAGLDNIGSQVGVIKDTKTNAPTEAIVDMEDI